MSIEWHPYIKSFYSGKYRCSDSLNACESHFSWYWILFSCPKLWAITEVDDRIRSKTYIHVVLKFLYVHLRVTMAMLILSLLSYYSLDRWPVGSLVTWHDCASYELDRRHQQFTCGTTAEFKIEHNWQFRDLSADLKSWSSTSTGSA